MLPYQHSGYQNLEPFDILSLISNPSCSNLNEEPVVEEEVVYDTRPRGRGQKAKVHLEI